MKNAVWVLCSILLLSCGGKRKTGFANVSCNGIEHFQCIEGIINIEQKSIGDYFLIDTLNQSGYYAGHIFYTVADLDSSSRRDSMVLLSSNKLKVSLAGDLKIAENEMKEKVESIIENNTTFFLSNQIRVNISNPNNLLHKYPQNAGKMDNWTKPVDSNHNLIFAVVTSMVYADKFEFRLRNSDTISSNLNLLKMGNYDVVVNYECKNSLILNAKQDGFFYKISYFYLDRGELVFLPLKFDFTRIETSQNDDE